MIARASAIVARAASKSPASPWRPPILIRQLACTSPLALLDALARISRQRASAGSTGSGPQRAIAAMCLEMRRASRSSPARTGVRESALLQVGRLRSRLHVSTPRSRRALAASRRSPRLLECCHQTARGRVELRVLAFAPRLNPNGHETELGSAAEASDWPLRAARGSGLLEECLGLGEPSRLLQCFAQFQLERDPGVIVRAAEATARPLKEIARAVHVAAIERTPARSAQSGSGPLHRVRESCPWTRRAPRGSGSCLLEVVADERVESAVASSARASRRSARAGRPCGFRDRVVGRVAQQQVAEAESVLAFELRAVGADRTPCGQARSAAPSAARPV